MNFKDYYSGMFLKKEQELQGMLCGTVVSASEERRLMDSFYIPFPQHKKASEVEVASRIEPTPYLVRADVLPAFEQYGLPTPKYFVPEGPIVLPSTMPEEIRQHEWLYGFLTSGDTFKLPNDIQQGVTSWLKESLSTGVSRSYFEQLQQSELLTCSPYAMGGNSSVKNALNVLLDGNYGSGAPADYVEHYLREILGIERIADIRGVQYSSFYELACKFIRAA